MITQKVVEGQEGIVNAKITFADIWEKDSKIRILFGGMVADGMMIMALAVLTGIVLAL